MARRKTTASELSQETGVATADSLDQQPVQREPGDEPERPKLPNPFEFITDVAAGVHVSLARDPYQAEIRFDEGKPSDQVRQTMKDAGFRWNPPYEAWTRPVDYRTQAQDRLIAERTARSVIKLVHEEKGIEPSRDMQPAF